MKIKTLLILYSFTDCFGRSFLTMTEKVSVRGTACLEPSGKQSLYLINNLKINILTIIFILIFTTLFSYSQQSKIDSLKLLLEQEQIDTSKVNHLNTLAISYITISPDSSLNYSEKAADLAEQIDWKKGLGNSLHSIGYANYALGNFDKTLFYWEKALAIREKLNIKKDISASLSNIATVYLYLGNYSNALEYSLKSLKIDEETVNKIGIASTFNNIGNIYKYQNDDLKALEYYFKAVKINEELRNKPNLSALLSNIGNIYKNKGDYTKALEYFFKTLKINEELGNKNYVSVILGNIGNVYKNQKNYSKALESYFEALKLSEELENKIHIVSWKGNIGTIYSKLKKYDEAEKYLFEAIALSDSIGALNENMQLNNTISELFFEKKDFQKAYKYSQTYSTLKDSLFNLEKNKQITEMQTKYETEKKQKENEILTQENIINALEIKQQKTQRTILVSIFAFLLTAGFLIFNRIRLKQENKILLEKKLRASSVFQAQEKEKVHLSKELHDGLGPLLSLIKLNVSSLETNSGNEKMLTEIKELASEGMKEVRNISHTLMPTLLEKQGLEPALREFTEQINQSQTLKADFTFTISSKLTQDIELNIYRIVQETLNNALKHADANNASIHLIENKQQFELTISDNGKGFDVLKTSEGNGLNNIHSRVDFLNGKTEINSIHEKGTTFKISIPKNGNVL